MIYQVPASAATKKENRFEFRMPGSRKAYSLPLLQYIPPKLALDLPKIDESDPSSLIEFMGKFLHRISPSMDILDLFEDQQQFMDFFQAWQDASTVSVGESQASASSSESTEAH
jgi:hypothetical protein